MNMLKQIAHRVRDFLVQPVHEQSGSNFSFADVAAQLQLKLTYQALAESGKRLPGLDEVGFKVLSQTDEDGILLFIFSIIGTHNKKSVEICAGNGIECNTSNLIIHHGWSGLLIDGNASLVKQGQEFYQKNRYTYVYPPTFAHSWITRKNVNDVIRDNGFEGEIDLLSIDMDGMDYWIWETIDAINPRVVVVEYQDMLGPNKSLTVPYQDDFNAYVYPVTHGMPNFCGASLPAFVKLARKRGYRLVGCNQYGYNAFFIRDTLGGSQIPEIPIEECFKHPKVLWGMKERLPTTLDYPWVEV
jgi:hypothetical protein